MTYESQTEFPKGSSAEINASTHGSSQWKEMRRFNSDEKKFFNNLNGLLVGDKTLPNLQVHDSTNSHPGKVEPGGSTQDGGYSNRTGQNDHNGDQKRSHSRSEHPVHSKSKSHSHHDHGESKTPLTPQEAAKELTADIHKLGADLLALSPTELPKNTANEIINEFNSLAKSVLANYDRQYSNSYSQPSELRTAPVSDIKASALTPTSTSDIQSSSQTSTSDIQTSSPTSTPDVETSTSTSTPAADTPTPAASAAGVPDGTKLTKHVGDIVITKPGTVLDDMDIYGRIKVEAANVTIKDCVVHGDAKAPTFNTALIDCNSGAAKNVLIEDSTLTPTTPSVWTDGVIGHDYTAKGVNTYNVVDGFGVYNNTGNKKDANVTIEDSYIHDLSYFANDPNHSDGTHNDGIQVQGGGNIRIIDNTIEAFKSKTAGTQGGDMPQAPGSGILIQGNVSPIFNLIVEGNTIDGSKAGINIRENAAGNQPIGEIIDNRLGRDEYDYGNESKYPIRVQAKTIDKLTAPLTLNVWADNGEPLADGRNLGIRYDS